jgi:DNA-binding HxlR family transcriptional regulator
MSENAQPDIDDAEQSDEESQCYCPLGGVMDLLSRKYAIQVICVVGMLQPVRYGEIEATFGEVSSSTLSTRLDELTDAGLLERERYAEIPPRVEYDLTVEGEELCELLEPLLRWVEKRNPSEQ